MSHTTDNMYGTCTLLSIHVAVNASVLLYIIYLLKPRIDHCKKKLEHILVPV